jgi:hypothetical protein
MTYIPAMMRRLRELDDASYLQGLLAYHAAPTLAGIKPASLVCPDGAGRDLEPALAACAEKLGTLFGVEVKNLGRRASVALILIYRSELLRSALAEREAAALLSRSGYAAQPGDVPGLLAQLRQKCSSSDFPHEIGVFLGYPAADVGIFMAGGEIRSGRDGAALAWRAFGDLGPARSAAERFRSAKLLAARLIAAGADLLTLAERLRQSC